MVEYTEQEKILVDKCVNFYRKEMIPDDDIDKNDPKVHIAAVDYCHGVGRFIRNPKQHDLKDSILEKNGVEVESDAVRQVRLKKERLEKISGIRIDRLATIETQKKAELDKAIAAKEKAKQELKTAALKEKSVSAKEARAKAAQQKAETLAKEQKDEIARLKAELAAKKDTAYLAEAAAELAKGEEAELTVDPPVVVEVVEPPAEIVEPEVVKVASGTKKEKTVDELIEDLKEE